MLSLSAILPQIVLGDPLLQYGLQYRLFNLTQLARHIRPHVEVRSKKKVSDSAILMALSRYQKRLRKIAPTAKQFKISKLTVHTGLVVFSFEKSRQVLETANALHKLVLDKGGYLTISEGISEVTVIVDRAFEPAIRKHLGRRIIYENTKISALAVHFSPKYLPVPGLLCVLLQQIMLQGINLQEVASTYTEFVLYIDEANTQLAFDTLYRLFEVRG